MSDKEFQEMVDKANKWDALDKKIEACYVDDNGEEIEDDSIDLGTIGEIAAMAFGWL